MLSTWPQILGRHYRRGNSTGPYGNRRKQRTFPVLDELYNGDELKPDARERLLSMLDDTEWTM